MPRPVRVRIVSLLPVRHRDPVRARARRRRRRRDVRVQLPRGGSHEADRVDVGAPRGSRRSRHRCRRQGADGRRRGPVPPRPRRLRRSRSRARRDAGSVCGVRGRRVGGRRRAGLPRVPRRGAHARSDDARRGARLDPRCRRRTGTDTVAARLVERCRARLDATAALVAGGRRPATLVLEWTDPAFTAGHWVPDLVTGGRRRVPARPAWATLGRRRVVDDRVVGRRGRARRSVWLPTRWRRAGWPRTSSGAASSRPTPRCGPSTPMPSSCGPGRASVDGVELFASILHPDLVGDARSPRRRGGSSLGLTQRRPG